MNALRLVGVGGKDANLGGSPGKKRGEDGGLVGTGGQLS